MKNISGVEFKRDVSGKAKSVTIDLQKHGKALQFFLDFFFQKNFRMRKPMAIANKEKAMISCTNIVGSF